jgi:integrase
MARGERKAMRDELLVLTLYDAALRVSEGLGLTPSDLLRSGRTYRLNIKSGTSKTGFRQCAISPSMAERVLTFCYQYGIPKHDRIFDVTKRRVHQIVERGAMLAGLEKPEGVGMVHVLRHAGAIARLKATGNARSVQAQLGHTTPDMTMRYFKTITIEEGIEAQSMVDLANEYQQAFVELDRE